MWPAAHATIGGDVRPQHPFLHPVTGSHNLYELGYGMDGSCKGKKREDNWGAPTMTLGAIEKEKELQSCDLPIP
ncbi:MAG: hypothetical protein CVU57_22905 [Deltaproteobacteria bacterium HGW-Deltaproteobacteria-15]|nr:MAG: hypothetical protein CVU57_22905 [Deltaproteobacteria bacterium HGW-Deltaproteobacteria-15]